MAIFIESALSVLTLRRELSLKSWMSMALTTLTKKPASFNAKAMGRQYIPVCSMTIRMSPPMLRSVFARLDSPAASCSTWNGVSTTSPPGLRTATVLFPLDTSMPTAVMISYFICEPPESKMVSTGARRSPPPIQLAV